MPSRPDFGTLFEVHSGEIFAYLWRLLRETADAEDCLQETFLRAFRAYSLLDAEANHRAWLYKIATNVASTHLKRKRRVTMRTVDMDPADFPERHSLLDKMERRQRLAAVAEAVMELPHKQRAALILRKYQGLNYQAVAAALGISQDAARANVYQALKKLRARFQTVNEESRDLQ